MTDELISEPTEIPSVPINDTSFDDLPISTDVLKKILFTQVIYDVNLKTKEMKAEEMEAQEIENEVLTALLTKIEEEPLSYKEALGRDDKDKWKIAINDEMNSIILNDTWTLVDKRTLTKDGQKPNIIDSSWVFKLKRDKDNNVRYKARLVIRGFKDKNSYNLGQTYTPVPRLALVRVFLATVNKYDLLAWQFDIKTAFLNGEIRENIYMHIPEGKNYSDETKRTKVCKLKKTLYGLKTSPKRWYERLTLALTEIGLIPDKTEPSFYGWRNKNLLVIVLVYVDDIIVAGNDEKKLNEVKTKLLNDFQVNDLGEPQFFIGIRIRRDPKNKILKLSQENYIDKIL